MRFWPIMFVALAACGSQHGAHAAAGNKAAAEASEKAAPKASKCDVPKLDFRASNLDEREQPKFIAQFQAAFDRACREGLFADLPLVDPQSFDPSTLFVMNAPEANVTSIYFGLSAAPPSMLLESRFGSPPQIPSADDLHEAMYCAVHGATPQEEEESGRCLPD
ncbi:MAG: hypothetical protein ACR2JJ_11960 [Sphingomicrobium sp.]